MEGFRLVVFWCLSDGENIYLFLNNYITSERAVSHNVLYFQQLSIGHYQVRFYANNYLLVITNSV